MLMLLILRSIQNELELSARPEIKVIKTIMSQSLTGSTDSPHQSRCRAGTWCSVASFHFPEMNQCHRKFTDANVHSVDEEGSLCSSAVKPPLQYIADNKNHCSYEDRFQAAAPFALQPPFNTSILQLHRFTRSRATNKISVNLTGLKRPSKQRRTIGSFREHVLLNQLQQCGERWPARCSLRASCLIIMKTWRLVIWSGSACACAAGPRRDETSKACAQKVRFLTSSSPLLCYEEFKLLVTGTCHLQTFSRDVIFGDVKCVRITSSPGSELYVSTERLEKVSAPICQALQQRSTNYSCEKRAAVWALQGPVPPCLIQRYIRIPLLKSDVEQRDTDKKEGKKSASE
ncbi:uncharacterized protein V6R79_020235 [Siganus canaliculatus]